MSAVFNRPAIIARYRCPKLFPECKKSLVFTAPARKEIKAETNLIDCSCGTINKREAIKE